MTSGAAFRLTLLTNDAALAVRAERAGIDRIGLDLETIGKRERQGHLDAMISDHHEADLAPLRAVLGSARLFVRANPPHPGTAAEVERILAGGAEVVMLPMFETAGEAARFVEMVGGRAEVVLLVETPPAMARIREIAALPGVGEIHVGLNDLHLGLGLASHFEVLTSPLMEMMSEVVRAAGKRFAFGGVGRVGVAGLPIPPDLVIAQYPRLQGSGALVARVFGADRLTEAELAAEVRGLRARFDHWAAATAAEREEAARGLRALCRRPAGRLG